MMGGSCMGGMGHIGVGGSCRDGLGWVMQELGRSCRGGSFRGGVTGSCRGGWVMQGWGGHVRVGCVM